MMCVIYVSSRLGLRWIRNLWLPLGGPNGAALNYVDGTQYGMPLWDERGGCR